MSKASVDLELRAAQNTGVTEVRPGHEIDLARLSAWMAANVADYRGPLHAEQFKGGQSNPTYKLSAGSDIYVLRRKPRGALLKSAHAIEREYRVMNALRDSGAPIPRMHGYCADESVIGVAFFVMSFEDGRVIWDLPSKAWSAKERGAIWQAGAAAAAKLHAVDYGALGLNDFGKVGGYVARQLKRWEEQYAYTRDAIDNPAMDKLIAWLKPRVPEDEQTTIVHGDLQISNMIFHRDRAEVLSIIDWELSTLGNPLSDFAYYCRDYHLSLEDGGFGASPEQLGIASEADLISAYANATGFDPGADWSFYVVFNMFRLAAIRQGVAKRLKDGTATSANAAATAAGAVLMAKAAWDLARRS